MLPNETCLVISTFVFCFLATHYTTFIVKVSESICQKAPKSKGKMLTFESFRIIFNKDRKVWLSEKKLQKKKTGMSQAVPTVLHVIKAV